MSPMTLPIPVIETDRLILRAPAAADLEAHVTFMASDRSRFVGGPQDRWPACKGFASGLGHWVLKGFGFWTIADKATDDALGKTGFIDADGWDEPELGWQLYEQAEGKGIAFEAVTAARAFGAQHFGLDGVISYLNPANTRTVALAERLGARFERDGELLGIDCQVWRHPKQGEQS